MRVADLHRYTVVPKPMTGARGWFTCDLLTVFLSLLRGQTPLTPQPTNAGIQHWHKQQHVYVTVSFR